MGGVCVWRRTRQRARIQDRRKLYMNYACPGARYGPGRVSTSTQHQRAAAAAVAHGTQSRHTPPSSRASSLMVSSWATFSPRPNASLASPMVCPFNCAASASDLTPLAFSLNLKGRVLLLSLKRPARAHCRLHSPRRLAHQNRHGIGRFQRDGRPSMSGVACSSWSVATSLDLSCGCLVYAHAACFASSALFVAVATAACLP